MLDFKFIKENLDLVKENSRKRGYDVGTIDQIMELGETRRQLTNKLTDIRTESNNLAKLGKSGKVTDESRQRAKALKQEEAETNERLRSVEAELDGLLALMPNMLDERVPLSGDSEGFALVRTVGEIKDLGFPARGHDELGTICDLIDIERGTRVAGSRFYMLKNELVLMRSALMRMFLDMVKGQGWTLVSPPLMAKDDTLFAAGYLPFARKDNFRIAEADFSLIGTSEQSLLGMHLNELLPGLPLLYLGDSMCFRTEVGSAGRDTRGILRVHQFYKLEQFVYCMPEESEKYHLLCLENEEKFAQLLDIPYRVIICAAGDTAAPGRFKYDVEAWMPGQGVYRELTSNTNLGDFQTRRGQIRYKPDRETRVYPHTISATGFSDRIMLAILENHQQADGSVRIPDKLRPYLGIDVIPARRS